YVVANHWRVGQSVCERRTHRLQRQRNLGHGEYQASLRNHRAKLAISRRRGTIQQRRELIPFGLEEQRIVRRWVGGEKHAATQRSKCLGRVAAGPNTFGEIGGGEGIETRNIEVVVHSILRNRDKLAPLDSEGQLEGNRSAVAGSGVPEQIG